MNVDYSNVDLYRPINRLSINRCINEYKCMQREWKPTVYSVKNLCDFISMITFEINIHVNVETL